MSTLPPLIEQEAVRHALGTSLLRSELPGSLLLHGPGGNGKQRIGLWLAQRLLCEQAAQVEPCGQCHSCHLALRLEHPDIHWFFPLARPKSAGSAERLAEVLEEARGAELAARREQPWRALEPAELMGIYLAQVLTLRRLAMRHPAMGKRKVFVIGDAEHLVSQEASTEAANALLKVLEEPPPDTMFVVTASDPDALLPTIKSRLLPIRIQTLPEDTVARLLQDTLGADARDARLAARLSQGSIGRALAFLPRGGEPGPLEAARQRGRELLAAALAPQPVDRFTAALATPPAGARATLTDLLDSLALWIRDLGATLDGAPECVVNVDATDFLQSLSRQARAGGRGVPEALRSLDLTRGLTRSNINPQLALAGLLREIRSAFIGPI
jgi:DNA polymerase-3 subunit delta'